MPIAAGEGIVALNAAVGDDRRNLRVALVGRPAGDARTVENVDLDLLDCEIGQIGRFGPDRLGSGAGGVGQDRSSGDRAKSGCAEELAPRKTAFQHGVLRWLGSCGWPVYALR